MQSSGGVASGGLTSTSSAENSSGSPIGDTPESSGGNSGPPSSVCFVPESVSQDTDSKFVDPLEVRDRITRLLLGVPSSAYALPDTTTRAWAAELARQIARDTVPLPFLRRFFAFWFDNDEAWNTQKPYQATSLALEWGDTWATTLAQHWSFQKLMTASTPQARDVGLLTDTRLLSRYTEIANRGAWLTNKLLCLGAPPEPTNFRAPPPPEGITRRDHLAAQVDHEPCRSCHHWFDPAGWALEHFDERGEYRTSDRGLSIDSAGELPLAFDDSKVTFSSINDLSEQLVGSCAVAHCMAKTLTSMALNAAGVSATPSEAELQHIANEFRSEHSALDMIAAIAASPSMLR
ncbi:MAG TPA: DUF1588 domain-containing protein [Polyangiaceae bacterium]|nr:DUF1588 domain-containing protein [Polyangiaceae bacterium]